MPIIATTIVSTLAQTAGTISQVADAKKRREYEQGLSMLTLEERQRLERDLLRTTSKDKRLEVLANAFAINTNCNSSYGKAESRSKEGNINCNYCSWRGCSYFINSCFIKKKIT
jgi:hypothetical protein